MPDFLAGLTPPIPAPIVNDLVGLGQRTLNAVTLPGDTYAGRVAQGSADYYDRAADLAQLMVGTPGGKGGLGSGVRASFSERMQEGRDLAQIARNKGQGTGNYGMTGKRTAPDAPKGSFDRLAAETRSRWNDDKNEILNIFREATGQPRLGEAKPLLAPGESAEDLATFFSGGNKKAGMTFAGSRVLGPDNFSRGFVLERDRTPANAADWGIAPEPQQSIREQLGGMIDAPTRYNVLPIDKTPAGNQFVLPGAERASDATMAQRAANAPLRPTAPQKPADFGLFGDEANQGSLFSGGNEKLGGLAATTNIVEHEGRRYQVTDWPTKDPARPFTTVQRIKKNGELMPSMHPGTPETHAVLRKLRSQD